MCGSLRVQTQVCLSLWHSASPPPNLSFPVHGEKLLGSSNWTKAFPSFPFTQRHELSSITWKKAMCHLWLGFLKRQMCLFNSHTHCTWIRGIWEPKQGGIPYGDSPVLEGGKNALTRSTDTGLLQWTERNFCCFSTYVKYWVYWLQWQALTNTPCYLPSK